MAADYPIPAPSPPGLNGEFYDWLVRGELRFQRCQACETWRHPPRLLCAACGSRDWAWVRSSARAKVFSWTVSHRPLHPDYADEVPYSVLIVEMEEGPRLVCSARGIANKELRLDLPVEIGIAQGEKGALPFARPRS